MGSSDQKSSIRTLASKCCVSYKVVVARERCAPGNDSISAQKKTLSSWYLTLTCPRSYNNGTCKQIRRFLRRENFEKVSTTQANRNQLRFWIIYARIPVFFKHLLSICCFSPAVEDAVVESSFEDNAKNLEFPMLLTVKEDSGNLPVAVRAEQFSDGDGESDDEQELYL